MVVNWLSFHKMARGLWITLASLVVIPASARAQTWSWNTELIDILGTDTSIVADREGNLHLAYYYAEGGQLRYGFRPAGGSQWFKMSLDHSLGGFSSQITVDAQGNPHICYSPRILKYAHFDGRRWSVQQIDPGIGLVGYSCSIKIAVDGSPRISWFVESGSYLRYGELKDGVWMARTLDSEGWPGKWNSLGLDTKGLPYIAYSQFPWGRLKYASFDGNQWHTLILDQPGASPGDNIQRGLGASLVLDAKGNPIVCYYDLQALRLARFVDGKWQKEVIEPIPPFGPQFATKSFRITILLDSKGNPHIGFENLRGLEHTWWDGQRWHSQLIVAAAGISFFESAMAMDSNDNLYISYKDPADGVLRLAIGHPASTVQNASAEKAKPSN